MMHEPLVSVVIVSYNGKKYLSKCLDSVFKITYSAFEVVLVDNGSTDGSIEKSNGSYGLQHRLIIVKICTNVGVAEASNIGLRYARGKYAVFLNNDTTVDANWLTNLVKVMERDVSIAAAQSKLLSMDDPTIFDCAGGFLDYTGNTYARGRLTKDVGQFNIVEEIFVCNGASMMVRMDSLHKVGSVDSDYCFYYDDTDLCWRFWLAGFRVVYVPTSVVYHKGGATLKASAERALYAIYLLDRNRLMTLLKNYEIRHLIRYVIPYLLREFQFAFMPGLRKDRQSNTLHSIASIKAIFWNFRNFRKTWRKRLFVQQIVRVVPDSEIMPKMQMKVNLSVCDRPNSNIRN